MKIQNKKIFKLQGWNLNKFVYREVNWKSLILPGINIYEP